MLVVDRLGYNHVSLFPDLQGLAKYVGWGYKWDRGVTQRVNAGIPTAPGAIPPAAIFPHPLISLSIQRARKSANYQ